MEDVCVKNQYSCITNVPDHLLNMIFEKLNKKCDRDTFGLTCHRFLKLQNLSRKRLNIEYTSPHLHSYILDKFLNRFSKLQELSLDNCSEISDSDLNTLQKIGSTLRCLSLSSCRHVTDIGLSSVASCCPLLSIISLYGCSINDNGLEVLAKFCISLIEVNLAYCLHITDHGIQHISQNCLQVKALKITGCIKISGVGFRGCSSVLAFLEANICAFDSAGVTEILSGGGLEYLKLSFPSDKHTIGHGLAAIGLGNATNLKILDLRQCIFIDDDDIISISKGCPLLEEWDLTSCDKIGILSWESIGLYCQNLQIIHVNRCNNFSDGGLLCLGNGCKRLSVIYIEKCLRITQSGITSFYAQRGDVKIKRKGCSTTSFPSWRFTWPSAKCFLY